MSNQLVSELSRPGRSDINDDNSSESTRQPHPAEAYFDEAAKSVMQRVQRRSQPNTASNSDTGKKVYSAERTSSSSRVKQPHAASLGRHSRSKDLTGWLKLIGLQHMTVSRLITLQRN